jgi:transcriptional regulator with XRE-family HTH domain
VTFGEQVVAWRKAARLSGSELERRLGYSRGYLSRLENDMIAPSHSMCARLADALRRAGLLLTDHDVISAAVPYAADPWVREWYEGRIRDLQSGDRLEKLEVENARLRSTIERVRRALE